MYGASLGVCEKLSGLQRQTLGRRLEDIILNLLEYEIMAKNAPSPNKAPYLIKARTARSRISVSQNNDRTRISKSYNPVSIAIQNTGDRANA